VFLDGTPARGLRKADPHSGGFNVAERRVPVAGAVDLASAAELRTKLLVLVNATDDDLVLDCDGVEFIDSTGVSVLYDTRELLLRERRTLRIENLRGHARRAFEVLGLEAAFDISEADPEPEPI
jgi:anti-sigma B factor antagonist